MRNRFIQAFDDRSSARTRLHARMASAEPEELQPLGFSRRKAEYVVGLARSDSTWRASPFCPDNEVKARLTALPGIGEWTADWFLARHLARPEAWPAGDLGLRKAVLHYYGEEDTRAAGERFAGHENLAAHYLLTGLRVLG